MFFLYCVAGTSIRPHCDGLPSQISKGFRQAKLPSLFTYSFAKSEDNFLYFYEEGFQLSVCFFFFRHLPLWPWVFMLVFIYSMCYVRDDWVKLWSLPTTEWLMSSRSLLCRGPAGVLSNPPSSLPSFCTPHVATC